MTRAGVAGAVAAGAAVAALALSHPSATAGDAGDAARPEPAPVSVPVSSSRADPDTSVSSPVLPFDPGYWTPERMASAKPMPMPSPGQTGIDTPTPPRVSAP